MAAHPAGRHDPAALLPKVRWLTRLRWAAIVGQTVTIAVAMRFLDLGVPRPPLAAIVLAQVLLNLGVTAAVRRGVEFADRGLLGLLVADVLFLTALLHFAGGPSNPFNFLYLVYIVLAAVLVGARAAAWLTAMSAVLFSLLFLPAAFGKEIHVHAMMKWHLQGMWVAFVIAAGLIVSFMGRIDAEVAAQREALAAARARAERSERLSSLATVVAGAAHELGTPLSTIAVVSGEVARGLAAFPGASAGLREDADILRSEVARCRAIIERMAESSGYARGEAYGDLVAGPFVRGAFAGDLPAERFDIRFDPGADLLEFTGPRIGLSLALRALLKNALDASPPGALPRLHVSGDDARVAFEVLDDGAGIPEEARERVVEPFFTTKPPGKGMGLGLFLADNVMRELRGRLRLEAGPGGRGTRATLEFPRSRDRAGGVA